MALEILDDHFYLNSIGKKWRLGHVPSDLV